MIFCFLRCSHVRFDALTYSKSTSVQESGEYAMKSRFISSAVVALLVGQLQAGEFQTIEFEHNNATRTAEVYLPTDFDPTQPTDLVYAIHGFTMNGEAMMMAGDFDDAAEQFDVVVVAPSGIGDFPA